MFEIVKKLLAKQNIYTVGAIKIQDCKILREYKLKNAGFDDVSSLFVYIFAIPYYPRINERKNISTYAIPRDYHAYFDALSSALTDDLKKNFPQYKFAAFADNSPIDERLAAVMTGIGIKGENGLVITEKYSSYVFLGEIITDMPTEMCQINEIKNCIGCKRCAASCPKQEIGECLSSLTQKKGALTDSEIAAIKKHGSAWGCDLCQECCPHTAKAIRDGTIYSPIEFFNEELTPYLTKDIIEDMSDEEFAGRAYSWRKKETILRNLEILSK